jgi:hypothetical protein
MWLFSSYPVRTLDDVAFKEYDYVVVGGESPFSSQLAVVHPQTIAAVDAASRGVVGYSGTAGCVLASRLSENQNTRVLLLVERGPVIDTCECHWSPATLQGTRRLAPSQRLEAKTFP